MSDWDGFENEVAESQWRGPICQVCLMLDRIAVTDEVAARKVEDALARKELSANSIRKALLKRLDAVPTAPNINRHRRGECASAKERP